MNRSCFVVMPFGDRYLNEYYSKIVRPAVEELEIEVIRADDIYGTRTVIDDVFDQIKNATVIIADVTGKNPNVNYELGAAHILEKNVIILSQTMDDVPFDYQHRRIITYDPKSIDFAQKLKKDIQSTIDQMPQIIASKNTTNLNADMAELEYTITDTPDPSVVIIKGQDQFIKISTRDGRADKWEKGQAIDTLRKAAELSSFLNHSHETVKIRRIFHDCCGSSTIFLDYLIDASFTPTLTKHQLESFFSTEHDGIVFEANVRLIKANFNHDRYNPDSADYYDFNFTGNTALGFIETNQELSHILSKDSNGYYHGVIKSIYKNQKHKHMFFELNGLLPTNVLPDKADYVDNESHWLAIWSNRLSEWALQLNEGDAIQFTIAHISDIQNYDHVQKARTITIRSIK